MNACLALYYCYCSSLLTVSRCHSRVFCFLRVFYNNSKLSCGFCGNIMPPNYFMHFYLVLDGSIFERSEAHFKSLK